MSTYESNNNANKEQIVFTRLENYMYIFWGEYEFDITVQPYNLGSKGS